MIKRYQIPNNRKWLQMELKAGNWKNLFVRKFWSLSSQLFWIHQLCGLAFSQSQFSLCIQFAMFQNGHFICQGPPPTNSASPLLNSKHPWEKRNQQIRMTFFNEVTQIQCHKELFPSSSQLWPGVEQDYVEQRNWENSLRKMCGWNLQKKMMSQYKP